MFGKQAKDAKDSAKTGKDKPVKSEGKVRKRLASIKHFFIETKAEFKKIVWPAPKQVLNNTIVVLVMIFAIGVVIWGLDAITSTLLNTLLGKLS